MGRNHRSTPGKCRQARTDPRGHPVAWGSVQVALAAVGNRLVVAPVVVPLGIRQAVEGKEAAVVVAAVGSVDRQGRQPGTPRQALMYRCCCSRRSRSRS